MTQAALDALVAERDLALELGRSLSQEEWAAPSDCAGWRVQDVYGHMASIYHQVADPSITPPDTGGDNEAAAERMLDPLRDLSADEVLAEYQAWSDKALAALGPLQEPPLADTVISLGNLGSHPLHLLANAFVFDHYCHLRHDVLRPCGPIDRPPLPADELRLRPTLEWMLAGLPQMCADGLASMDRPLALVFVGPAVSSWVLQPPVDGGPVTIVQGDGAAAATVTTGAHDFVQWGTKRRDWRTLDVRVEGDEVYAAAVLDVFNVI
jgi:uncharacterized protein (TIGR03083 family)